MRKPSKPSPSEVRKPESGPGALCSEAQADGVPCTELGRSCETCEKAMSHYRTPDTADVDPR
jgi:hypothetical protein